MPHPLPSLGPNSAQVRVQFFIPETPLSSDLDGAKTKELGRPVYKTNEYVRVSVPGNTQNIVVCLAHEKRFTDRASGDRLSYADAFPEEYRLFKQGMDEQIIGTPLAELPALTNAKRAELKAVGIRTIEDLAAMEGSVIKKFGMEGPSLKTMAVNYLDRAKGLAVDARNAAENAALRAELEAVKEQLSQIAKASRGEPLAAPVAEGPRSSFEDWEDDDIKAFIKERAGAAPAGRVSHETLVKRADDILAKEIASQEAEAA